MSRPTDRDPGSIGRVLLLGSNELSDAVARELLELGADVVVVSADGKSEQHSALGVAVIDGDPTSEYFLEAASIRSATALISALETDDENALVCLAARALNPRIRLVLRGESETSIRILMHLGADAVVCPEVEAGRLIASAVLKDAHSRQDLRR